MTEAVCYLYEHPDKAPQLTKMRWAHMVDLGWTETPLYPAEALAAKDALRPMRDAPKDRTFVLVKVRDDCGHRYSGRCFVAYHEGVTPGDYDMGWGLFPGFGGVNDVCLEGWLPLPALKEKNDDAC